MRDSHREHGGHVVDGRVPRWSEARWRPASTADRAAEPAHAAPSVLPQQCLLHGDTWRSVVDGHEARWRRAADFALPRAAVGDHHRADDGPSPTVDLLE